MTLFFSNICTLSCNFPYFLELNILTSVFFRILAHWQSAVLSKEKNMRSFRSLSILCTLSKTVIYGKTIFAACLSNSVSKVPQEEVSDTNNKFLKLFHLRIAWWASVYVIWQLINSRTCVSPTKETIEELFTYGAAEPIGTSSLHFTCLDRTVQWWVMI